ncbi:CDP-diacylglycerol--glycerol-3-phosphate 3-phosphatidyltransferase, putative [Theobroma cacao]|uniref:CDP-diacylglycerol--glycerol-3-phosphate 3-phosphatidyltransferase, putative n=1 Tax=Theobroma cacao TaxID=3641 RepID=A0A061E7I5_THECC|nr:CDP-diacylglycerol--glycerol-3-phosphate 3-phosphatidyltransferase, putative [Theobroma cacao]
MEPHGSSGTSWADQWDYGPDPLPAEPSKSSSGGAKAKCSKKVEDGLGKTKAAAVTGMKKAKVGAAAGINWIKEKCSKTTQK